LKIAQGKDAIQTKETAWTSAGLAVGSKALAVHLKHALHKVTAA
jgi:hypothetical protein